MTSPLPRVRSTNWAIRAWKTYCLMLIFNMRAGFHQLLIWNQWWVKDSNLRKLLLSDLQSDPVGHLGNSPFIILNCCQFVSIFENFKDTNKLTTEPTIGLEPMTCRLQGGRSANWAMSAQWIISIRAHHYNRGVFFVKEFFYFHDADFFFLINAPHYMQALYYKGFCFYYKYDICFSKRHRQTLQYLGALFVSVERDTDIGK